MAQFGDFTVDRNSTKYVLGSGGTIISYATDEPAFEFNADGSYKGLLVEPAATNICLQSENISTSWTPTNATITTNDTTAPDGTTTADKLNDNNSGGSASVLVSQGFTGLTGGAKYTASVFLKADGLNWAFMQATNYDGSSDGYRYFDLLNGALGSTSGLDDSQIVAYPNGWYHCSITWTQGAADTSFDLRIYVANSDGNATVDRDGTSSIFVWGAQVETGPIATSYIPTTTASVTRVKDDITLGSASSLIGQTEGTLYVEVDWRLATGTFQDLFGVNDATVNNRLGIYIDSSSAELRMFAQANGVILTIQGANSTAYTGIQKFAFAYKTDDFELYRNGSSISSDTSGSLAALATLTDIDLGQTFSAGNQANMWIRSVALFTRRLSDAEAQALTTL
jgi:hypothetical protein